MRTIALLIVMGIVQLGIIMGVEIGPEQREALTAAIVTILLICGAIYTRWIAKRNLRTSGPLVVTPAGSVVAVAEPVATKALTEREAAVVRQLDEEAAAQRSLLIEQAAQMNRRGP